jgi:chemotaxis protein MotB
MRRASTYLVILLPAFALFNSCVSSGKYKAMETQARNSDSLYNQTMRTLKTTQDANVTLAQQKTDIQTQMTTMSGLMAATQENNALLRKQLTDLSTLSSSQAESIRRSLDNIGAKDVYIQQLRAAISHRDSVNLALLIQLKAALGGYGEDVAVRLDNGVVSVEFSEKLLFDNDSNQYNIDDKAKSVMGRLARVLNDQPDVEFTVLAHTESNVHPQEVLVDDWDLSVKRATSVVRMLQTDFSVSPLRMTASGRSEYAGMAATDTPEGRAANRKTKIVLQPQLEPLIRLLDRKSEVDTAAGK